MRLILLLPILALTSAGCGDDDTTVDVKKDTLPDPKDTLPDPYEASYTLPTMPDWTCPEDWGTSRLITSC
jgi:hypothetical protein